MATLEEIASRFPKAIEELQRSNERAAADSKLSQSRELTDLRKAVRESTDKRTREHKDNVQKLARMNENIRESAKKEEELSKTSAGQAMALKKQLEDNGKIAEDNKEFQKLSYQARKADFKERLANAETPAAKKQIREDARADAKKNGSRLDKIAAGIGGLFEIGKKGLKNTALGGLAVLGTLAFGAALVALGKFLQSDSFKNLLPLIKSKLIPVVEKVFNSVKSVFALINDTFGEDVAWIAGVTAAAAVLTPGFLTAFSGLLGVIGKFAIANPVLLAAAAAILAVIEAMDYFRGKAVKKAAEDSNKLLEDFNKEKDPAKKRAIAKKALAVRKRMVQVQFDDIDIVMDPLNTIITESKELMVKAVDKSKAKVRKDQKKNAGADSTSQQLLNIGDAAKNMRDQAAAAFATAKTEDDLKKAYEEQLRAGLVFANEINNDKDRELFFDKFKQDLEAAVKARTGDGQGSKLGDLTSLKKRMREVSMDDLSILLTGLGGTPKNGNGKPGAAAVVPLPSNTTEMLKKATAAFDEANNKRMQQNQARIPGNFNTPIPAIIDARQRQDVYNTYEGKYNQVFTRNVELNRGMAY